MMALFTMILDFLLKPQECKFLWITRIFGYVLIVLAAIFGLYFLFEFLVPVIGYIESGALLTLVLAGGGCFLIYFSRRKKSRPLDDLVGTAKEVFGDLDIDKLIKKNSGTIIFISFVSGLALSQLKDLKMDALNKLFDRLKKNWPFD